MDDAAHTCPGYKTGKISLSDPWISRYGTSALLEQSSGPAGSDMIEITDREVYGDPEHPIRFRIGNGGAGYTGILRVLCEQYIHEHGNDFRIGWISNHSRHSQIALLADVVQVALTYEPENEESSINEGWATRVCRVFNDHFILVGPDVVIDDSSIDATLRDIAGQRTGEKAQRQLLFHTRGDGSATSSRESQLWEAAGVDVKDASWIETYALTPYQALLRAERAKAFLVTDRATFLTAKQDGKIPSLRTHVEGSERLLNPCSALVLAPAGGRTMDQSHESAHSFARWLAGPLAQNLIRQYGKDWRLQTPLFTVAGQQDFDEHDRLSVVRLAED